jgi:hypothetical protein
MFDAPEYVEILIGDLIAAFGMTSARGRALPTTPSHLSEMPTYRPSDEKCVYEG